MDEGRDLLFLRWTAPPADVHIIRQLRITILAAVRGDDEDLWCKFQEVAAPRHRRHLVRPSELGGGDSVPEAYTLEGVGGQDLTVVVGGIAAPCRCSSTGGGGSG